MWRARDRVRSAAAASSAFVLAFLLAVGANACGAPPVRPPATGPARPPTTDAGTSDPGATTDGLPSLDALAARGPTEAPLMREALRTGATFPRSPDVRADKDLCLRAVFASSAAARAWFADESGVARGEATAGASGTVPPRGPVCVKRGEAIHLVVESTPGSTARAVIFAAP